MKAQVISSKKVQLTSEYCYFDLLPIKKYHECNTRIPQTVLLDKGYIRDWVFNSAKYPHHPILKKKKQNITTFSFVKAMCHKSGYTNAIQSCTTIISLRDTVKEQLKQQKDYDFVKDKKVIDITTISNDILSMSLVDFLEFVAENKYSEQSFYEKWKMIQEKVCFNKIDEFYRVDNVRNNHTIQSKCQKIITHPVIEGAIISTELNDDASRKPSNGMSFQIGQTKNIQGYKFFDTFLNKKFFQMSGDIIEFIEKNLKCLVESVTTKFVINRDRQPYLVGIYDLEVKPAKKIADMKQFQVAKEKGCIKMEQYERFLQTYIHENIEKAQNYNVNTPISQRRGKCKGKFCQLTILQVNLPVLLQHKLKLPLLSSTTRVIQAELRDAVVKKKRRIIQKLNENQIIPQNYEIQEESSEYETEGEDQTAKPKPRQLKVCQNCYMFYFHVNRFYDLDIYGNLIEKKIVAEKSVSIRQSIIQRLQEPSVLGFMTKDQIKNMRSQSNSIISEKKDFKQLASNFANQKLKAEQREQYQHSIRDIKPITSVERTKILSKTQSQPKFRNAKLNQKPLTPIKSIRQKLSDNKNEKQIKSEKVIRLSREKTKLQPIGNSKKQLLSGSVGNNFDIKQTHGHRLMTLTKLSQPVKFQQRDKSKTMRLDQLKPQQKQKKPQNFVQAYEQLVKKLNVLPDSSKQQFIHYAKIYYKQNLPQPIERRNHSTYYDTHLYQFMSLSPISIHPKRRIKKRPEMSLKRLSELTDYPEIISRSQFIFDTVIINEQTTISFCVMTTQVVNPDNNNPNKPYQNIFLFHDIFDCFIQNISLSKQLLEQSQLYNKRIILFNYPGQSHTIYNTGNTQGYSAYFCQVFDKLVYRLSSEKGELGVINLEKDVFKFCGFGFGAYLLQSYLGSYSLTFDGRINSVMLVNPFMRFPKCYVQLLQSLKTLYSSNDPTIQSQSYLYYNKAIHSEQTSQQDLQHKAGLNPIRIQDRLYLLQCALSEHKYSITTTSLTISPEWFQNQNKYLVSVVYGKNNVVIPKDSSSQILRYINTKQQIQQRVFIELSGGHDIMADNYDDIFRVLTLFFKR